MAQAERGGGAADTADDGALHIVGCGRGREIDRLLEERTVQRIGLVEDRERRAALPAVSSPSSAYSRPGMNPSMTAVVCASFRSAQHVRLPHERPQPRERRDEPFGVVGPHHAAAARQRDRFEDTGIRQWQMADGGWLMVDRPRERTRVPGRPASRRRSRVSSLCRGRGRALDGMPRQPELSSDAGRDDGRPVADDDQAVERPGGSRLEDGGHGRVLVVEADRNRVVLPRILDQVTPIRREDEFDPEPRGGVTERARLVAGRRR